MTTKPMTPAEVLAFADANDVLVVPNENGTSSFWPMRPVELPPEFWAAFDGGGRAVAQLAREDNDYRVRQYAKFGHDPDALRTLAELFGEPAP